MLLAAFCAGSALAAEPPPKVRKDFFGQGGLGAYDAQDDALGTGFVLANRYGWYLRPNLHAGIDVDWYHATESVAVLQGTQRVVHDARFDHFPVLGYVQLEGKTGSPSLPYVGAGLGYQIAFVEGSGLDTEIFHGWGWGCWAGLAFRIRVNGAPTPCAWGVEAFYHSGDVSRTTDDPATGVRTREWVDAGGVGARFTFRFRLPEGT